MSCSVTTLLNLYANFFPKAGCDKNMPGVVMAMARLNRPSLMVYGGTIRAGCSRLRPENSKLDVVNAFQSYGEFLTGKISEEVSFFLKEQLLMLYSRNARIL
jgi:dihydroxyacid dehydratase/phosphogluconate dehydratase